jgi:protocatechuate 3,4-dioxygenase beta subunit
VVIDGLNAGVYAVTLQPSGAEARGPWELRNANQLTERVDLPASGSERLILGTPPANPVLVTGRVTRGGAAVAEVIVACRPTGGQAARNRAVQTNEAGEYSVSLDMAGEYNFSVGSGNGQGTIDYQRKVPEGETVRFDFDLPTMSISGVITGPDGSPVADVRVSLQHVHDESDPPSMSYRTSYKQTDEDGHYEFETLQAGTYHLRAGSENRWGGRRSRSRFAQAVYSHIEVEEGKSVTGVDLQLETPGSVVGIVYGPDGSPAENVWVQASNEADVTFEGSATGSTDENGRFRLTGLPPGTVKLIAREAKYSSAPTEVKIYSEQESETELRLRNP